MTERSIRPAPETGFLERYLPLQVAYEEAAAIVRVEYLPWVAVLLHGKAATLRQAPAISIRSRKVIEPMSACAGAKDKVVPGTGRGVRGFKKEMGLWTSHFV